MRTDTRGLLYTLSAFVIWGLSPLFWKALLSVPAGQLLAHRIVWAALILGVLLTAQRRWGEARSALQSGRVVLTLLVTTALIGANWWIYVWAIVTERVLQASLGYYINPLVTVLLAMVFLGERLDRAQWGSLALAAAGVAVMIVRLGEFPWIALVLAVSFAFYGLLRKQVGAEAEVGLLVETGILTPVMIGYLVRADLAGNGALGHQGVLIDGLLVAAGAITAVPLLLFTHGARRLPLSAVGFLQYLAPTLQFLLAIFLFREPFTGSHFMAFACIWAALALFTWDLSRRAVFYRSR
ncbi:MAG: EamA family transporter RarD [Acidobacteriota bacterium]|nr:EamA family transporter RarD [Acidobacteriota bacterium]